MSGIPFHSHACREYQQLMGLWVRTVIPTYKDKDRSEENQRILQGLGLGLGTQPPSTKNQWNTWVKRELIPSPVFAEHSM